MGHKTNVVIRKNCGGVSAKRKSPPSPKPEPPTTPQSTSDDTINRQSTAGPPETFPVGDPNVLPQQPSSTSSLPTIYRESSPSKIYRIWNTICKINKRGLLATVEGVQLSLSTADAPIKPDDVVDQIQLGKRDGLLLEEKNLLTIPEMATLTSVHDVYCFKCHLSGEVTTCKSCPRIYCDGCKQLTDGDCEMCTKTRKLSNEKIRDRQPSPEDVSRMLTYEFQDVDANKTLVNNCLLPRQTNREEQTHRFMKALLKIPTSLPEIKHKIRNNRYKCIWEFELDIHNLIHNVHVIYGTGSTESTAVNVVAKLAFDQTLQMRECIDCYLNYIMFYYSKDKPYFTLKCDPPHETGLRQGEGLAALAGQSVEKGRSQWRGN